MTSTCRWACWKRSTCSRTREELTEVFGRTFVTTFAAVKRAEFATFMRVISPWEREFLLLERLSAHFTASSASPTARWAWSMALSV